MTGVTERLKPLFGRVDEAIKANLGTDIPFVRQVCEHSLLAGGKRLRPALFILGARLCGYQPEDVFDFSIVFEYFHAATLMHDDVIDEADTRRGQPAAHIAYGNTAVILIGDYLIGRATEVAARSRRFKFIDVLSRTAQLMSEGEVLQLLHAHDAEISEREYFRVIYRKTGALIEAASRLGPVLAGAAPEAEKALGTYGKKLGQAFQIMDDVLDYTSTASEFGKPVGHDLDEGKITLPVIRALGSASAADHMELKGLVIKKRRTPGEFARVIELITRYKGIRQARDQAAQLVSEAKASLAELPGAQEKADLLDLADYVITRRK